MRWEFALSTPGTTLGRERDTLVIMSSTYRANSVRAVPFYRCALSVCKLVICARLTGRSVGIERLKDVRVDCILTELNHKYYMTLSCGRLSSMAIQYLPAQPACPSDRARSTRLFGVFPKRLADVSISLCVCVCVTLYLTIFRSIRLGGWDTRAFAVAFLWHVHKCDGFYFVCAGGARLSANLSSGCSGGCSNRRADKLPGILVCK